MSHVGQLMIGHQLREELEGLVGLRVERPDEPGTLRLQMALHHIPVSHLEALAATNQVKGLAPYRGDSGAFLSGDMELGAGLHIGLFSKALTREEEERYFPAEEVAS